MKTKSIFGALCLSFAACIWGGMFVVVKTIVGEIPPIQLVWLRYLIATVVLGLIAWGQHIPWHWDWPNLRLIILAGLIGDTLSIVLQETGTWLASAQLGAVITTATPTAMVLFSWPLLHRRPQRRDWLSLTLATAGVIAIVGVQVTGRHVGLGALCLLLAGLTWALMSVLIQLIDARYSLLQVTLLATLVAVICLTPIVWWQAPVLAHITWTSPHVWGSLLYLGAVSTALAFLLWNLGLRLLQSRLSGLFFLWQPVTGALLGWWLLAEPLSWGFVLGLGLILASTWVAIRFDH